MAGQIVYLLRHEEAEATTDGPDGHRALTALGRRRMHITGRRFAALGERIDLIITSPLVRAVQTAEVLATALAYDGPLLARNRVAEPASLEDLRGLIDEAGVEGLLVVGHEPTLSAFAAHLLGRPRLARGFSCGCLCSIAMAPKGTPCTFRYAMTHDAEDLVRSL